MSGQEREIKTPVTRREFLKNAGIVTGSIGMLSLAGCIGGTATETKTNTNTVTNTVTKTVEVTKTVQVPGSTITKPVTVEADAPTMTLTVNGQPVILTVSNDNTDLVTHRPYDVYGYDTLLYTLRETLALTGTKSVCDRGACGCCTVLMDGEPVLACMLLTTECDGKSITTIEGLEDPVTSKVNKLQQAFIDNTAFQCGMCTPGIIMCAQALLDKNSNPTKDDICDALANHFCRCASHYQVIEAILAAAGKPTTPTFTTPPAPTASIEVIPTPNVSLAPGKTKQFKAIMRTLDYSTPDITSTATWTSSNPAVATISSSGLVTAVAVGKTVLTASQDGITSSRVLITVEVK